MLAIITSRLDYCKSVLAGLPDYHSTHSNASRVVFNLSHHDHITLCLIQLHWLPVRARVQYKLCRPTLMHSVHNNRCPTYISDAVQSTKTTSTRGGLRSAESYQVRRARLLLRGTRTSFQAAFKRQLQTFLFSEAFNIVIRRNLVTSFVIYERCNAPTVCISYGGTINSTYDMI